MDTMRTINRTIFLIMTLFIFVECSDDVDVKGELNFVSSLEAIEGNLLNVEFSFISDLLESSAPSKVEWFVNKGSIKGDSVIFKQDSSNLYMSKASVEVDGISQKYEVVCCVTRSSVQECFTKNETTVTQFPKEIFAVSSNDSISMDGDTILMSLVYTKGVKGISSNILITPSIRISDSESVVPNDILFTVPPEIVLPTVSSNLVEFKLISTGKKLSKEQKAIQIEFDVSDGLVSPLYSVNHVDIKI